MFLPVFFGGAFLDARDSRKPQSILRGLLFGRLLMSESALRVLCHCRIALLCMSVRACVYVRVCVCARPFDRSTHTRSDEMSEAAETQNQQFHGTITRYNQIE